jgi:hypothetical protein
MDVARSWKKINAHEAKCGPLSLHKRAGQWEIYHEPSKRLVAQTDSLTEGRNWIKAYWRDLQHKGWPGFD